MKPASEALRDIPSKFSNSLWLRKKVSPVLDDKFPGGLMFNSWEEQIFESLPYGEPKVGARKDRWFYPRSSDAATV